MMNTSEQSALARHEYKMKAWYRSLLLILGASAVSGGIVMFVLATKVSGSLLPAVMTILFLGFGIYLILTAQRSRVIIESHRIEVRGAFTDRQAGLNEIEGYRIISSRNGKFTQIYLNNGRSPIMISNLFNHHDGYDSWFQQLRNLDKEDRDTLLERISSEQSLGTNPQERLGALSQAKNYSLLAFLVAVASAIAANWGVPSLYVPFSLVLALVPVVLAVMMHRAPLLYTLFKRRDDPRAELFYSLIASSFGLLIRARGVHFVSLHSVGVVIALIAIMYLGAFYHAIFDNISFMRTFFALLLFGMLYAYGVVAVTDAVGDQASSTRYVVHVIGKHYTSGRSRSFYLDLEPWGPMQKRNCLGVSKTVYDKAGPGDQICLELRPGRLNAAWYTQVFCYGGRTDAQP